MPDTRVKPNLYNPIHLLAFGFGSGLPTKAPGTFGSLAAMLVWWALMSDLGLYIQLFIIVIGFVAGIYICQQCAKDLGVHDYGGIVWDEWIGLWITYLYLPHGIVWLLYGFVLFRVFDILKPPPISWLDKKVAGGLGIMLDDVLAGLFALAVLQASYYGLASMSLL